MPLVPDWANQELKQRSSSRSNGMVEGWFPLSDQSGISCHLMESMRFGIFQSFFCLSRCFKPFLHLKGWVTPVCARTALHKYSKISFTPTGSCMQLLRKRRREKSTQILSRRSPAVSQSSIRAAQLGQVVVSDPKNVSTKWMRLLMH